MKIFRVFLIIIGIFFIADTIFALTVSSVNLGVLMPGIIGAPLLILGIFFIPICAFFGSCVFGSIIKWGMIVVYAAFFALFATTTILTVSAASKKPNENADALIVLGAGLHGDVITLTLKYRLDAAFSYLVENPNTVCIVSGGKNGGETVTEAFAMKKYLVSLGILEERIIEEGESTSTFENFTFSNTIIKAKFGENASTVFVSTNFHVYRAALVAKSMGLNISSLSSDNVWFIAPNDYLRECAAITEYWMTGKV
ncbi:MAG: YdcF family protein [Clostridia bacterium]